MTARCISHRFDSARCISLSETNMRRSRQEKPISANCSLRARSRNAKTAVRDRRAVAVAGHPVRSPHAEGRR